MDFGEYQSKAFEIATYPFVGRNIVYPAMGVAGEAGELCDKIKKHWRNTDAPIEELKSKLTDEQFTEIVKEMGDVLWYLGALATELNIPLETVAKENIKKLYDRRARNVIKSQGDNR
jgi:NTP pyrophosphatase (non-canonical NTP hydrolase)